MNVSLEELPDADPFGRSRTVEDWEQDPGYNAAMHRALTEDLGPASDRILAKLDKRARQSVLECKT